MVSQFLLATVFFAAISAAVCVETFDIEIGSNLFATYLGRGIHYECDGLVGSNIWTRVSQPTTPVAGVTVSFDIDVRDIAKTSEVKFTLYTSLILRWTNNGKSASWNYYVGGFKKIGDSKILPGTGTHTVSVAMCPDGTFTIVEDGVYIGNYEKGVATVTPTYHMQMLSSGGVLDIFVSEITSKPGRLPEATVVV